jgi:hypothetical protein
VGTIFQNFNPCLTRYRQVESAQIDPIVRLRDAAELAPPTWPREGGRFRRFRPHLGNSELVRASGRLQLEKSVTKTDF